MNRMEHKKRAYTKPEIKVYPTELNNSLLQASITPSPSMSYYYWDNPEEIDEGSIIIGDPSSVAPAKNWGNVWEEEE